MRNISKNIEIDFGEVLTSSDIPLNKFRLVGLMKKGKLEKISAKSEFSKRTVNDVVSGDRTEIMAKVTQGANQLSQALGITVVDVRLKKVDLPDEVSNSVYARMVKERATVAKSFRSKGKEEAKGITSLAERESETIIAEAYKKSQEIKGEGDAQSTQIYANAFSASPEFYSFYRSLEAYKSTFNDKSNMIYYSSLILISLSISTIQMVLKNN